MGSYKQKLKISEFQSYHFNVCAIFLTIFLSSAFVNAQIKTINIDASTFTSISHFDVKENSQIQVAISINNFNIDTSYLQLLQACTHSQNANKKLNLQFEIKKSKSESEKLKICVQKDYENTISTPLFKQKEPLANFCIQKGSNSCTIVISAQIKENQKQIIQDMAGWALHFGALVIDSQQGIVHPIDMGGSLQDINRFPVLKSNYQYSSPGSIVKYQFFKEIQPQQEGEGNKKQFLQIRFMTEDKEDLQQSGSMKLDYKMSLKKRNEEKITDVNSLDFPELDFFQRSLLKYQDSKDMYYTKEILCENSNEFGCLAMVSFFVINQYSNGRNFLKFAITDPNSITVGSSDTFSLLSTQLFSTIVFTDSQKAKWIQLWVEAASDGHREKPGYNFIIEGQQSSWLSPLSGSEIWRANYFEDNLNLKEDVMVHVYKQIEKEDDLGGDMINVPIFSSADTHTNESKLYYKSSEIRRREFLETKKVFYFKKNSGKNTLFFLLNDSEDFYQLFDVQFFIKKCENGDDLTKCQLPNEKNFDFEFRQYMPRYGHRSIPRYEMHHKFMTGDDKHDENYIVLVQNNHKPSDLKRTGGYTNVRITTLDQFQYTPVLSNESIIILTVFGGILLTIVANTIFYYYQKLIKKSQNQILSISS